MQEAIDAVALKLYKKGPALAGEYLTNYCIDSVNRVVSQCWDLVDKLIAKYDDGYINIPTTAGQVDYPEWWLKEVGYHKGLIAYKKPTQTHTKES